MHSYNRSVPMRVALNHLAQSGFKGPLRQGSLSTQISQRILCQGFCNEVSRKTLARMFPIPHYRKCPRGGGGLASKLCKCKEKCPVPLKRDRKVKCEEALRGTHVFGGPQESFRSPSKRTGNFLLGKLCTKSKLPKDPRKVSGPLET